MIRRQLAMAVALLGSVLLSPTAFGCNNTSIEGSWGAIFSGISFFSGLPRVGTAIVEFDGAGGVRVNAGRESSGGTIVFSYYGTGRYGMRANCSGLGSVTLFDANTRTPTDFVRFEFTASGTNTNPVITGVVMNSDSLVQYTGSMALRRIDL